MYILVASKLKPFKEKNINFPNYKLTESQKELMLGTTSNVKGFWKDFSDFAVKGNVIDLAVGVVIGTAFNKIVQSLVTDIITPIIGRVIGNSAFADLYINLSGKAYENITQAIADGAPVIKYGSFISNILDFFIVAFSLFVVLKIFFRKKKEAEE